MPTCDVRRGRFSKGLVTVDHTHTWWCNTSPLIKQPNKKATLFVTLIIHFLRYVGAECFKKSKERMPKNNITVRERDCSPVKGHGASRTTWCTDTNMTHALWMMDDRPPVESITQIFFFEEEEEMSVGASGLWYVLFTAYQWSRLFNCQSNYLTWCLMRKSPINIKQVVRSTTTSSSWV